MDELVDILDSKGNPSGKTALKSEAHKKGLFHPTIHVWCYSLNGGILLQQRGRKKETYPLKWDVSVAGHIEAGEDYSLAAIREMAEEIGVHIAIDKLEKLKVIKKEVKHSEAFVDREFCHVYLCLLNENIPLKKQESEVEALQWMTIEEFKQWVESKHPDLIPNSEERFYNILSEIKTRIQNC